MWSNLSLRFRILSVVAALTCVCLVGGVVSFWFTLRMNRFVTTIIDKDLVILKAAEELNTSLVMQKGYLTYFSRDGNVAWLEKLSDHDKDFRTFLAQAEKLTDQSEEKKTLELVKAKYLELSFLRDRILDLYKEGDQVEGFRLQLEARQLFFEIKDLTDALNTMHWSRINRARTELLSNAGNLARLSLIGVGVAVLLGTLLALVLFRQILQPIRLLAREAVSSDQPPAGLSNEVQSLREGIHHLKDDVDEAQSQLRVSQKHLIEASKLASVGRLAAGVAHSIRNPLTSVKMRLFSLERTLQLTQVHQDDFKVISEEIRHIDNIVRNFLEFSRRPKLRVEPVSPSDVVDQALTLLSHRLESYGVRVKLNRPSRLPKARVDPEQLKEVLVNLMVNACEALAPGPDKVPPRPGADRGLITITESRAQDPESGRVLVIRVQDNGPGIPEGIMDRVFEPFFTTKDEGTGLGLSIATRIIEEHEGRLDLESGPGQGAAFIISLLEADEDGPGENGSAPKEAPWTES